jgi:hypothetical protein
MEVKMLRTCCENACAISVMYLSDANSLRYAAIVKGGLEGAFVLARRAE